jgi:hypothetical protein
MILGFATTEMECTDVSEELAAFFFTDCLLGQDIIHAIISYKTAT